jgi:hypothetical protein
LQTLEWVAIGLVVVALLAALAFGLKRAEAGPGEALSAAVSAWFRCLIGQGDCPLMAVRIEKAGPCWTQPVECLVRWGDCLLRGACEGADPKDLAGLLLWLAVAGIPAGGVVFALLPSWVRRRRWAWPRLPLPPPRVPPGRPSGPSPLSTPQPSNTITLQDILSEFNRIRRMITGPIFGSANIILNLPAIYKFADEYKVDPKSIMAIIYYESDAIERLPVNLLFLPVFDLDLWKFLLTDRASIGIGQVQVDTALDLEENGWIRPMTPSLFGNQFSRRLLVALRLTIGPENVRYIAANLASIRKQVEDNSDGLRLSPEQKMVLTVAGYNVGQGEIVRALRRAQQGDRQALSAYLAWPYARQEILPIYSRLQRLLP